MKTLIEKILIALLMFIKPFTTRPKIVGIFMMGVSISKAEVSLFFNELSPGDLVDFTTGVILGQTNNNDLVNLPDALTDITTAKKNLAATNGKIFGGDNSGGTKRLQKQQFDILCDYLEANAHYTQDTANRTAAGNLERAEEIILDGGHKVNKHGIPHGRSFEIIKVEDNAVHVRAVKGGPKGSKGHLWRYGLTPEKGTPPTTTVTQHTYPVDVVIEDVPSKSVFAVQHAECELSGKTKRWGHPTFSLNMPDPYAWSNWIYVIIP